MAVFSYEICIHGGVCKCPEQMNAGRTDCLKGPFPACCNEEEEAAMDGATRIPDSINSVVDMSDGLRLAVSDPARLGHIRQQVING